MENLQTIKNIQSNYWNVLSLNLNFYEGHAMQIHEDINKYRKQIFSHENS